MRHVSGLTFGFHMSGFHVNGANRLLLSEIIDENNNSIHFIYEKGALAWVLLSDDRYIRVFMENRCITKLVLTDTKKQPISTLLDLTYDAEQQLISSHAHGRYQVYYEYDAQGRLLTTADNADVIAERASDALSPSPQVHKPLATESGVSSHSSWLKYTYDEQSRVISRLGAQGLGRAQWRYDDDNGITYYKNSYKGIVCYHKNEQHQLIKWINAKGGVTSFEWQDNQLISQRDPLGQQTTWQYDDWGQVCSIQQADNSVYRYHFNAHGKLESAIDCEGNRWQYRYDKKGNRIQVCLPSGELIFYQYTGRGQLAWIVRQDGSQMGFQYQGDSQLSAVYLPERIETVSGKSTQNEQSNDDNDNVNVSANTQYQKVKSHCCFAYDALGRLISQQWQTDRYSMKAYTRRIKLDRKADHLLSFRHLSVSSLLTQKPVTHIKAQYWSYDSDSMQATGWIRYDKTRRGFQYDKQGNLIKLSVFDVPKLCSFSSCGGEWGAKSES